MINLQDYVQQWLTAFAINEHPWHITQHAPELIQSKIKTLTDDFIIKGNTAIHKTAVVEDQVVLKGPIIISANCFVGAHAYLRGGVFLGEQVSVGPGCEIKSSFVMAHSALAHFNFAGDSIIGSHVNMEAGSIIANHHNDRENKIIEVMVDGIKIKTDSEKFGALVGDDTKIGANAVLSPGTILQPKSIVRRLSLVEQC
ncbi:MAG TPA: DapH/DapD/GlmU-related protein [Cyclobacteriaceae bacterium]|nr:DapH/DapD/GlmU-related protein [Cyclobacteriaceae bacterium]